MLADGAEARDARVRSAYDAIAAPYAEQLADELDDLPFERWLLDRVVAHAAADPVVEVGSGPGHVTAYLAGVVPPPPGSTSPPRWWPRPVGASPA